MKEINLDYTVTDAFDNVSDSAQNWFKKVVGTSAGGSQNDFLAIHTLVGKISKATDYLKVEDLEYKIIKDSVKEFRSINPMNGEPLLPGFMKAQLFKLLEDAKDVGDGK